MNIWKKIIVLIITLFTVQTVFWEVWNTTIQDWLLNNGEYVMDWLDNNPDIWNLDNLFKFTMPLKRKNKQELNYGKTLPV